MQGFLYELKRRNVIRVALLYLVTAWLLLQIADVGMASLGLPPWTARFILLLLALGLPLVLAFSWIYELTPDGLRRDAEVAGTGASAGTSRRLDLATLIVALVAIAVVAADRLVPERSAPDAAVDVAASTPPAVPAGADTPPDAAAPSIAVLPFDSFSAADRDSYFSEGLADTLLHRLAQVPNLKVVARNSSFQFRGTNRDVRELGRLLGVTHLLEGSVQRYENDVRVIAQLVSTTDGAHVWSKSFDRTMADIFQLHDEIAGAVADRLRVTLAPAGGTASGDTTSAAAYDLYIQALAASDAWKRDAAPGQGVQRPLDYPPIPLLRRAIELDPAYARAWAQLAFAFDTLAVNAPSPALFEEFVREGRAAAARAIELDPDDSEGHETLAWLDLREGRLEAAEAGFRRAISLNANNAGAHSGLGLTLGVSNPDEALTRFTAARELDPENPLFHRQVARALGALGNLQACSTELEQAIARFPDTAPLYQDLAVLQGRALGRPDRAAERASTVLKLDPANRAGPEQLLEQWLAAGDLPRARAWLARAVAGREDSAEAAAWRALVALRSGDYAAARAEVAPTAAGAGGAGAAGPFVAALATACLAGGDLDCAADAAARELAALDGAAAPGAQAELERAAARLRLGYVRLRRGEAEAGRTDLEALLAEINEWPRFRWPGGQKGYMDAEILAMLGRHEEAEEALEAVLARGEDTLYPAGTGAVPVEASPFLASLEGRPRYAAWQRALTARRDALRARMLELESGGRIAAVPQT